MATKKEVWFNARGGECSSELDALIDDFSNAADDLAREIGNVDETSPELTEAIDALYEYVHRGGTFLPIRPGRRYRTRGGREVTCIEVDNSGIAWLDPGEHRIIFEVYAVSGYVLQSCVPRDLDIVEEIL